MTHAAVVEAHFNIDETKIHVITRAVRLRATTVGWLQAMKEVLEKDGSQPEGVAQVDEAITWLNELEV